VASEATTSVPFDLIAAGTFAAMAASVAGVVSVDAEVEVELVVVVELLLLPQAASATTARTTAPNEEKSLGMLVDPLVWKLGTGGEARRLYGRVRPGDPAPDPGAHEPGLARSAHEGDAGCGTLPARRSEGVGSPPAGSLVGPGRRQAPRCRPIKTVAMEEPHEHQRRGHLETAREAW